ncbi:MAG: protease modulator HflC [Lachnospiraceae bacterium]|jgi:membrane protease subunit HflC|nr:protease modulator HflC [Lachnospiraceae bacterium]
MKKTIGKLLGIAVVVVILILAESSFVVTKENEYTLVKQFGKIDHVVTDAGLSFKLPFIQTTDTLPKATLLYDLDPSDVITMDKKTMVANSYVLWRITDPIRFAQTLNSSVSNAESRINTIVYNSMKNVISSMTQEEVISGRAGVLSQQMMEGIGNSIEQYGMELLSIEMKHLDLPGENKTAVYERMISERDKIAATYTAEGESEAQIIRNTTDKEIAISLSEAQAQAEKIEAEGEAEYMRVLSEAYADKSRSEFYSFVRALDAAKAALKGGNKTLVLDKDSPLAQIFYTE